MSSEHATDRPVVDLAVELEATPDEVWDAVATGPGQSAWLQPTRLEPRVGGEYASDPGSGWGAAGRVTAYDEPRRFATEAPWRTGTSGTTVTTTWTVEPHDDDTARLRMTVTGFGTGPAWHDEAATLAEGMTTALRALALYLRHFSGLRGADVHAWGPSRRQGAEPDDHERAHARFLADVGVIAPGMPVTTFDGVPELTGRCLERRAGRHHSAALLLLDSPAPGLATLSTIGTPPVHEVHATFFGADAEPAAAAYREGFAAWLAPRVPGSPNRTDTPGE